MIERSSGILMPISSLPSPHGIGTMGKAAYDFADFLAAAGQKYWQLLPLGPTSYGDSPYQSFSSFAGNPYFIDLDLLVKDKLLTRVEVNACDWGDDPRYVDYGKIYASRFTLLEKAKMRGFTRDREAVTAFERENERWLPNYALFMALKRHFGMKSWTEWDDEDIRCRTSGEVIERYRAELREDVELFTYIQFLFFRQWEALKAYIHSLGIRIIGDLPIYVSRDSVEMWATPELFKIDAAGNPVSVAGTPPDQFSATGQYWGNPIYDWDAMEADGFSWWEGRIRAALDMYDVIRLDHFRGFEAYWEVPFSSPDSSYGSWTQGPGLKFFKTLEEKLGTLPIIAEDLGFLTPGVIDMRDNSGFPGMSILQFGFNPDANSDYLPHRVAENRVYYTGTHDNAPIMQWFAEASESERRFAEQYLALNAAEGINWGMIRGGMCSPAGIFIAQMQDVLGLSAEGRVNTPGVASGNWQWRMLPHECSAALAEKLREYTRMYGRLHDCGEINFEHNSVVPHEYCGKNADTQKRYKLLVRAAAEYLDSVDN